MVRGWHLLAQGTYWHKPVLVVGLADGVSVEYDLFGLGFGFADDGVIVSDVSHKRRRGMSPSRACVHLPRVG